MYALTIGRSTHAARAAIALALLLAAGSVWGQSRMPATLPAPATAPADDGLIQLNLPPVVEMKVLIDYVSKRLGINIIYDDAIGATRVALLSPNRIKKDDLLDLLRNALKMTSLELVDCPDPNWKTIGRKATIQFVTVKNVAPADLAKRVGAMLEERDRLGGGAGRLGPRVAGVAAKAAVETAAGASVSLLSDPKTNQIVVIGGATEAAAAIKLIEAFDILPNCDSRTYRLRHVSPKRIDTLMRSRASADNLDAIYSSSIDEPSGLLIVKAGEALHREIELVIKQLDVEGEQGGGNIEIYKLVNTTAADVLRTIRALQGSPGAASAPDDGGNSALGATGVSGLNLPSSPGLSPLPRPGVMATPAPVATAAPAPAAAGGATSQPADAVLSPAAALAQSATVTADQNTNTIIVIAPPDVQKVYKRLIKALDKRRPQVMVEVTLVAIDTSKGFTLGVELSKRFGGENNLLMFSAFGLSKMDLVTGKPTILPSTGFNGILISPDSLNVVVQALATNSRSRVLAAPKILMNDNATGTLASVSEAPFTSINASDTVSTTSFAGYATAGTTVAITPHISEGDFLQLKYSVTLNSFTEKSSGGVPPPRQTDTVGSDVTVPNGYAVIVGGLSRKDVTKKFTGLPFLGDIPIVKYLFGVEDDTSSQSTLFVFIRPTILRDDQFEDLKYLSDRDLAEAKLPPMMPSSEPIEVK